MTKGSLWRKSKVIIEEDSQAILWGGTNYNGTFEWQFSLKLTKQTAKYEYNFFKEGNAGMTTYGSCNPETLSSPLVFA